MHASDAYVCLRRTIRNEVRIEFKREAIKSRTKRHRLKNRTVFKVGYNIYMFEQEHRALKYKNTT